VRDFFISFIVIASSSIIVLVLASFTVSIRTTSQIIAILLLLILVAVTLFYSVLSNAKVKYLLLFLTTLVVQLLVSATGGWYSPFLILIHLLGLGISFVFSLSASIIFLAFSFFLLIGNMLLDPSVRSALQKDPVTVILYSITFLSIIPLSRLLAHTYKVKDAILAMLAKQIEVEESILSELSELVILTDKDTNILAVNDAVEQMLHKSRAELLGRPLFSVFLLKNIDGVLLSKEAIGLNILLSDNKAKNISGISLIAASPLSAERFKLRIKPIPGLNGVAPQISFIIATTVQPTTDASYEGEAIARHDAMIEALKKKLKDSGSSELHSFVLITKAEKDIRALHTLGHHTIDEKKVLVDLAAVCRNLAASEEEFAKGFHVPIKFSLSNFDKHDITPLISPLFSIAPEQLTGPFFTASLQVKNLSIAILKLIEVAVMLASSEENPRAALSVERQGEKALIVTITANAPQIALQKQEDMFIMYYGELASKTNLSLGSGLEGYLAKRIIDTFNVPMKIDKGATQNSITFQLKINREKK